ncbi:MAG: hypothetical protein ABR519_08845 [Bacteroidales bacterium]
MDHSHQQNSITRSAKGVFFRYGMMSSKYFLFTLFLLILTSQHTKAAENDIPKITESLSTQTVNDGITISGRVNDINGTSVAGALVSFTIYSTQFAARTAGDGTYAVTINGIPRDTDGSFRTWPPFPNPTSGSVRIPFSIPSSGDVTLDIYSLNSTRVFSERFSNLESGSYRVVWNGALENGSSNAAGLYIYALTWGGKTVSGRIILTGNNGYGDGSAYLEPFILTGDYQQDITTIETTATISADGYHTLRYTGISFSTDTTANFTLVPFDNMPYAITGDFIGKKEASGYLPVILKGINLGSSPPGFFPGEIAYAIPGDTYERWIKMMTSAGFNSVRVYTLHPPVFYEKLAEYNSENPDNPLYLFQGIWLEEIDNRTDPDEYNLFLKEEQFSQSIVEVIDCIHGNRDIPFRPGRAYGDYHTDISPWVAGYIIGREVAPQEIDSTNATNSTVTSFNGQRFSVTDADPSEVFFTRMLDKTASYEMNNYFTGRPVSISSWPTLDPLTHPTEIFTDEDAASVDITIIVEQGDENLLFASYHAYPYYPDFISQEPGYRTFSDAVGPNSYLGYITDLRNHYGNIPLIIAEFGVPSSRGDAHTSFSGMNHGGHSEEEQGVNNVRLLRNILNAGGGGGFMFSWMDEWFKRTWIVEYLEAVGFESGSSFITTRQLWHNIVSPEQNFGLISFEQEEYFQSHSFATDDTSPDPIELAAYAGNDFLRISVNTGDPLPAGDSVIIAFDTYRADLGESVLPGGNSVTNRAEFMITSTRGRDTATLFVTAAYNMKGLTPRFNLTDQDVQKFRSTVSDGAPWVRVEWFNNGFTGEEAYPGILRAGIDEEPDRGRGESISWNGSDIIIDIPWTLIHFFDPTRMRVIDGATSVDGGYSWNINDSESDGVAISLLINGEVISTLTRFSWPSWQVVPPTVEREKASLKIIREGLSLIPDHSY